MHFVNSKSILSKSNGMNLYRGCSHGCIYCDSRSNVYGMNHDFEDVEVKKNSIELFRKALKSKKEKCMIGTGSMSDPYMPIEEDLMYTRQVLELIYRYGHGFTCITKSDLVLRDLDLILKINEKSKAVVQVSLTCTDDDISRIIEPNVISTNKRIRVLEKLSDAGIPCVVWLCPVLPFITDTRENIGEILDACVSTGVRGIICFGMGMTLRDGNREYFYNMLDKHFSDLRSVYEQRYGNRYQLNSPSNDSLMKLFYERTDAHNIMNDPDSIFRYLRSFPGKKDRQTTLF